MLYTVHVCCEVPGRKRKNRKGVDSRSMSCSASCDETPTSLAVGHDQSATPSSVDTCRMSSSASDLTVLASDVTVSANSTSVVSAQTVADVDGDKVEATSAAITDRSNSASGTKSDSNLPCQLANSMS